MGLIYEPRGKAREYSPLAVNLYRGCGHNCKYCYVPAVLRINDNEFSTVTERDNCLEKLRKEAKKLTNSRAQVFMSFTTDPYNPTNDELKLTREALKIFLQYHIPVSILTKGGKRSLQDIDIFKQFGHHIKIGATITYNNEKQSLTEEPNAATPKERLETLATLKQNGIKTWISFEPIIDPEQTLDMMKAATPFTDEFQFGKLSGDDRLIDWTAIVYKITTHLRNNNKRFYIKQTLRKSSSIILRPEEKDPDFLTLEPFPNQEQTLF
jgi:DNA repair photolyase